MSGPESLELALVNEKERKNDNWHFYTAGSGIPDHSSPRMCGA